MRILLQLLCLVATISSMGCRDIANIKAAKNKAQDLVTRRATTNEVAQALGSAPIRIYSRSDALEHLQKQPGSEQWKTMSHYPMAHQFGNMRQPVAGLFIYFDDQGRAASYYINVQ